MAIVTVGTQKTLTELTQGLLLARASRASRTEAESAIRAANPGLDLRRLTPGQVLVVPDLPQGRATSVDHVENAATAVVQVLDEQLDQLQEALKGAQVLTHQELDTTAEALRGSGVRRLGRDAETKSVIDELRKSLADQRRSLTPQADLDETLKGWRDEIDVLGALAGGK